MDKVILLEELVKFTEQVTADLIIDRKSVV